jgi:hypothetical protein
MILSLRLKHAAALAAAFCLLGFVSQARAVFTEQGGTWLLEAPVGDNDPVRANYTGRSASLADIDNDGDLDLLFQGASGAQRLWRNNVVNNGGTTSNSFTNVSSTMLPTGPDALASDTWSAAWADANGDGFVDLFVGSNNTGSNSGDYLQNTGTGFVNATSTVGLTDFGFHQNVAWADFNNDQRLDLIIGQEGPEKHELYLQDATGHFSPVGASVGIQVAFGTKSYGMAIGDPDADGDMDVYISTCIAGNVIRNNFFRNNLVESGTNTLSFTDIADTNGTQYNVNSYGTEFVDLDNDGDLDLFVTGADGNSTKFFRNNGNNAFVDMATVLGHPVLSSTGTDMNGSKPVDFDNDGDLDLAFHDNLSSAGNVRLFRNDGNWQFTNVTTSQGLSGGVNAGAGGYDSVWGDIDLDGDQDLINPNNSTYNQTTPTPERIFINDASTNGNKWLYLDLKGPSWNTTGLGSSVFATINSGTPEEVTLRREANTSPNTFNQSDLPVHFGLGTASIVDELLIQWPDGTKQMLTNVAVNQYLPVQYMPGDYSGDGTVDSSDYVIWRKGMGTTFNSNDYTVWRSHLGQSLGSGTGTPAVPEPASVAIVVTAALGLVPRRFRR